MRIMLLLKAACLSLMLSACVAAPLLMMSPTSQLMWALFKPLVGVNPNQVNLFEQSLVKDRMTAILGPDYDSTMQLLKTANDLQQEGPLFYVVSRYAPMPDVAKQAGMVWNAQTNQMSVMLLKGDGTSRVFGEDLATTTPTWPSAMQNWQAPAAQPVPAMQPNMVGSVLGAVSNPLSGLTSALQGGARNAIQQGVTTSVANAGHQAVMAPLPQNAGTPAVSSTAATVKPEIAKAVAPALPAAASSAAATVKPEIAKAVEPSLPAAVSSAAATVKPEIAKAVEPSLPAAASSAAATVKPEIAKAVEPSLPASASSAAATPKPVLSGQAPVTNGSQDDAAKARAAAEAELEALLQ